LSDTLVEARPSEARRPPLRSAAWIAAAFLALVAVFAVVKAPSLSNREFNSDEAYVATEAQVIRDGGRLYHDTVDRKPPALPYLYAAAFTISGSSDLFLVHVLAILADAITALLLALEARRRFGTTASAVIAAALFAISAAAFAPQDGLAANFETFMLPLATAAVLLGLRRRPAAAGFALGLATLVKQTGAVVLLPLVWLAWRDRRRRGVISLLVWFAAPIVVAALVFGVPQFAFWVFTGNSSYLDASHSLGFGLGEAISRTWRFAEAHLVLVVLVPLAWRARKADAELWLWLLAAAVSVTAGLRFFGHYYLELLPPACLLATRAVVSRPVLRRPLAAVALLALAVVPAVPSIAAGYTQGTGRDVEIADDVAGYVRAHTSPDDRILVWGQAPEVYWKSGRRPATRFATTGFVTGSTGNRPKTDVGAGSAVPGAWSDFLGDLHAHRPALVVDMSTANQRGAASYPPSKFRSFARYLDDGTWHKAATVDGATVYASS
jgi:hypothetical protein